jgi:hypothetical protein
MFVITALIASLSMPTVASDTVRCFEWRGSLGEPQSRCVVEVPDSQPQRRHAVEYSDWYARRLEIHKIGSYTMLPLFGAEYVIGDRLLNRGEESGLKSLHVAVATGIGALFTVNTVTGVWNLWESRSDPAGRTRRVLHAATMLASDGGFLWAAAIAGDAEHSGTGAQQHRNVALGSFGVATAGTVMMWLWKD